MKIFLFFMLFLNLACSAQTKKNTYFIDKKGRLVENLDSAAFIRVIEEPDSASTKYLFYELYLNNKKKRLGYVSQFKPTLVFEGQLLSFYKNGQKSGLEHYVNGKLQGSAFKFYENGKLKSEGEYAEGIDTISKSSSIYTLKNYFDSTGVQQVKDGTGYMKKSNSEKHGEEGPYKNGVKDGEWKGIVASGSYTEYYTNGVFKDGIARWFDGSEHPYDKMEVMPEFKGGMSAFYKYFGTNYRYPPSARTAGIQGKVIVQFVVQNDGQLSDFLLLKDIGNGAGEEAIRVLKQSSAWKPGTQHGIPVKVAYTMPIMLNLGR